MTKKCSGCGVLLQNDNIDKEGYVDDLNKDICFKLYLSIFNLLFHLT